MRPVKFMLLAFGAATAVGCSDGPQPLAAAAPAPKVPQAAAPAPVAEAPAVDPAVEPTYVYAYNPLGKRDPYRIPEEIAPRAGAADPNRDCGDPLCQWDLEQLTLTAVVTGDANPFGMLVDPLGRGYIVRRNARVGRQGGRVSQILRDALVVTEFWNQPDGKRTSIPKNIRMKPDSTARTPAMDLATGKLFD
jgi:type IV pilus assembly protein PilP